MKRDGVKVAVSAAAAVKMIEDGPAVQASRGTVGNFDLLYEDEEDRRYSLLGHSAYYDDDPEYRWQWGVMVPHRHPCGKVHLDGGSPGQTLRSAPRPGVGAVTDYLRFLKTVC